MAGGVRNLFLTFQANNPPMKCALLASGGKDCWLAAWYASSNGLDMRAVVTFIPRKTDSYMFHGINSKLVKKQARLAGIRHIQLPGSGDEKKELGELVLAFRKLRKQGYKAVITGAIESEYQKERVERACAETGLVHFAPLWRKKQEQVLEELLDSGEDAVIVAVAADGLGEEWLGRKISGCKGELLQLTRKRKISPIGEGGEFETFAFKSPLFKREMRIREKKKIWDGTSGFLELDAE